MKFSVHTVNKHGRLGSLSEIGRLAGLILDTPRMFVQTKRGSVPHLTYEVLQLAFRDHLPLVMPLTSTIEMHEQVQEFGCGIAEFVGLKESLTLCMAHDSSVERVPGSRVLDSEPIWTHHGKRLIDANMYMDMMEAFKPDMYVALADSDTDSSSSRKRIDKSLSRSSSMFQRCLERHTASKTLGKSALLAAVGGGYDSVSRCRMAYEVATYPVLGYVIEGLHKNGPEVDILDPRTVKEAVSVTLEALPTERLRIAPGAWHPSLLLALVSLGCDIFDSSLPFLSTERNCALSFPYREEMIKSAVQDSRSYEFSPGDIQFREDFSPLVDNCTCLACRKHSRAYIHHLIDTKELLARVLLMIHNLHHYEEFFKTIRQSIKDGSFEELERIVATCHSNGSS